MSQHQNIVLKQLKNQKLQSHKQNSPPVLTKLNLSQKSDSDRNSDKKVVDMMRLIKKNESSRISQINIIQVTYGAKRQQNTKQQYNSYRQDNNLNENLRKNEDRVSAFQQQCQELRINHFDESFLANSQNSVTIGYLLYVTFIFSIAFQLIAIALFIPRKSSNEAFYYQHAFLTILTAQLAYYYIDRLISKIFIKNQAIFKKQVVTSYKKLILNLYKRHVKDLQNRQQYSVYNEHSKWNPIISLCLILICTGIYSWLASSLTYLKSFQDQNYLISSIFWCYFAIPHLYTNFYLNRPYEPQNWKVNNFSKLIIVYAIYSLFQGYLYAILILFRVLYNNFLDFQQRYGLNYDIPQKIIILVIAFIYTFVRQYQQQGFQGFFYSLLTILGHVIMLVLSMIVTRTLTIRNVKEMLYQHYYTETHINMAYIYSAILLCLSYIFLLQTLKTSIIISMSCSIVFFLIFGLVIYLDGREKMIITMKFNEEQPQQQN